MIISPEICVAHAGIAIVARQDQGHLMRKGRQGDGMAQSTEQF